MADRSEHGWATVEEYLEDELADNSDDEKRMQKAEFRASRKLKAAAAKNAKKKAGSLQKRPGQVQPKYTPPPSGPATHFSLSGAMPVQQFAGGYPVYGKWPGVLGVTATTLASPPLQGPCFNCGKVGHVKKLCPLLQTLAQGGK